ECTWYALKILSFQFLISIRRFNLKFPYKHNWTYFFWKDIIYIYIYIYMRIELINQLHWNISSY
ncbi:MAG: hypothetical protein N7Q72_02040, partial [Spiroplasma sp. Tabriz.8]|nr:hypothetical protein [Spiroplasma sp. Tabriz.8]